MTQIEEQEKLPLVSIITLAYNHENYIRDCLEGILMQKTSFKFELIIHDDASTDNTANIIKEYEQEYPDIIKPVYQKENQYSKGVSIGRTFLYPRAKGKYIALCEGDDYWVDPLKLQKQVSFLEKHPEYVLSHTAFDFFYQRENSFKRYVNNCASSLSNKDIMQAILDYNTYRIQTNTVLYRFEAYKEICSADPFLYQSGYFLMGDTQLWIGLLQKGNVHYLNDCTSVYRIHGDSVCRSLNLLKRTRFDLSCSEMRIYLFRKMNLPINSLYKTFLRSYCVNLIKYMAFDYKFSPAIKPLYLYFYLCKFVLCFPFARHFVRNRVERTLGVALVDSVDK